jgi:hypothetical protein
MRDDLMITPRRLASSAPRAEKWAALNISGQSYDDAYKSGTKVRAGVDVFIIVIIILRHLSKDTLPAQAGLFSSST